MKKLALSVLAACSAVMAFADLYPSKRWLDIGVEAALGLSQNIVTLPQIFSETIDVNFTKIYEDLNGNDFVIQGDGDLNAFFKFQFGPIGGGVEVGFDNDFQLGVDNGVFKLLGAGNADDNITLGMGAGFQSYATVNLLAKFRLGRLGFTVRPTLFLPLAYMPYETASFSLDYTDENGYVLSGKSDLWYYCPIDITSGFTGTKTLEKSGTVVADFTSFNPMSLVDGLLASFSDIFSQTGFNLNAEVEYPLFNTLNVGVFTRVPVVPARLKYGSAAYVAIVGDDPDVDGIKIGQISDVISDPSSVSISAESFEYGLKTGLNSLDGGYYTVNMPFRLGVEGAWRPFGNWLTFRPMVGFGTRNPFGEDTKGWEKFWANTYLEYGLGAEFTILYVLGLNFSHQYIQQVFTNMVGLSLNLRVLEVDVKVATSSADFSKCWNVAGATAIVGVHFGL